MQTCLRCGKKITKCDCRPQGISYVRIVSYIVLSLVLIGCAVVIGVSDFSPPKQRGSDGGNTTSLDEFRETRKQYAALKSRNPDRWWLTEVPSTENSEFIRVIVERERLITETLEHYKHVSPFAGNVHNHFKEFTVSIRLGDKESMTFVTKEKTANVGNVPEVCFVPQTVAKTLERDTPSSLYWRSDWGLIMSGVEFPEKVFPGLLFHEAGHGTKHPVGNATVQYQPGTLEYFQEEVQMHELETLVIDTACKGKFVATIDAIIDRSKEKGTSWKKLVLGLEVKDFLALDEVVGAEKFGVEASDILFAEYLIAIGLRHIEKRSLPESEKVQLYKWLFDEVYAK